eukprot:7376715-Prymnesium_polylepis.1
MLRDPEDARAHVARTVLHVAHGRGPHALRLGARRAAAAHRVIVRAEAAHFANCAARQNGRARKLSSDAGRLGHAGSLARTSGQPRTLLGEVYDGPLPRDGRIRECRGAPLGIVGLLRPEAAYGAGCVALEVPRIAVGGHDEVPALASLGCLGGEGQVVLVVGRATRAVVLGAAAAPLIHVAPALSAPLGRAACRAPRIEADIPHPALSRAVTHRVAVRIGRHPVARDEARAIAHDRRSEEATDVGAWAGRRHHHGGSGSSPWMDNRRALAQMSVLGGACYPRFGYIGLGGPRAPDLGWVGACMYIGLGRRPRSSRPRKTSQHAPQNLSLIHISEPTRRS